MSPIETTIIIFCCVSGGAALGVWLSSILPEHHLNAETKGVINLGVGLIGTMAALLLGLLIASAKSSYDTRSGELTQMAANILLLDRVLAHYGPETQPIRNALRSSVSRLIDQVWARNGVSGATSYRTGGEVLYDEIQGLTPHSDAQRALQSQAESLVITIGQTRLLLFEQSGTSISIPFLVVVVFWLTILFVSFGLSAPRNATAMVSLLLGAVSVALALFLILELDHPFSGLIQISNVPLHNTLESLGK